MSSVSSVRKDMQCLARQIKRAPVTEKNDLYLSVYGDERDLLLQTIILSLPAKTYVLNERETGVCLKKAVNEIAGVFAEIDVTQKLLFGMSLKFPEKIRVSFTLGLDEIIISAKFKTGN